jgi:hypothetical protein
MLILITFKRKIMTRRLFKTTKNNKIYYIKVPEKPKISAGLGLKNLGLNSQYIGTYKVKL